MLLSKIELGQFRDRHYFKKIIGSFKILPIGRYASRKKQRKAEIHIFSHLFLAKKTKFNSDLCQRGTTKDYILY